MKPNCLTWISASALILCLSCSNSDDSSIVSGQELAGIYQVTQATKNETDCDAEGESVFADLKHKYFYVDHTTFLGTSILSLASCESIEHCRQKKKDVENGEIHVDGDTYGASFFEESGGFYGETKGIGSIGSDDTCHTSKGESWLKKQGANVIFEEKRYKGENVPKKDGECDMDDATSQGAYDNLTCLSWEKYTATFAEEI